MLRVHQDISRQPSVREEPEEEETTSLAGHDISPAQISTTSNNEPKVNTDGGEDKVPPRHVKVALNQTETKVSIEELNRHSIGRSVLQLKQPRVRKLSTH